MNDNMNDNTYQLFQSRFPGDRLQIALTCEGLNYSFLDIDESASRYANCLYQLNLKKGDRVAVQVEKSPQNLFLYLGCLKAGIIYLPLNTAYKSTELAYFIEDAEPALVVCDPANLEEITKVASHQAAKPLVYSMDQNGEGSFHTRVQQCSPTADTCACSHSDIAVILYTSGTTGKPKGAMISHGNLVTNALELHQAWGWQEGDVMLHALPIFHVHGLFLGCHLPLLSGSKIIFLTRFNSESILAHLPDATVYMGVPTHYTRLLAEDALTMDLCSNMRLFTSGSAPLLEKTFHEFEARTGHRILERYGMTETGMNTTNPLKGERKPGTVGRALKGVATRIVDADAKPVPIGVTGQLQVKGDNVFPGYWRMEEKTAEEFTADAFFKTGDLATIDADGYISIVGRSKDLIITGGLNVYPKEVEMAIDKLPGVRESAVIGLSHEDFGESVTAILVTEENEQSLDPDIIISLLKENLANFKVPKQIHFVSDLPRNTMGKVQKNILREQFKAS
jgi:malonyl-CoA/methylmalonyl-CoA synthetase